RPLSALLLGDVADKSREEMPGARLQMGHGELDGKFESVTAQRNQFNARVEYASFAGIEKTAQSSFVGLAIEFRDDSVRKALSDDLLAEPAESNRRSRVPIHDAAIRVHAHNCVQRRLNDLPVAFFAGLQFRSLRGEAAVDQRRQ